MAFYVERELTDEELESLKGIAENAMTHGDGKEACDHFGIMYEGRNPVFVMESIVLADKDHKYPLSYLWPDYVRHLLKTKNWQIGYGFVGQLVSDEPRARS